MTKTHAKHRVVRINRAPVLTLWAAVVAERLGFDRDEALTLGRAVAGLNAYAKGVSLGLFTPTPEDVRARRAKLRPADTIHVDLLHRAVPAIHTPEGLRALSKEKPIDPGSVARYLRSKFGDALDDVESAMHALAASRDVEDLRAHAYALYEAFRPTIPSGTRGWGASGDLDLERIRALAAG